MGIKDFFRRPLGIFGLAASVGLATITSLNYRDYHNEYYTGDEQQQVYSKMNGPIGHTLFEIYEDKTVITVDGPFEHKTLWGNEKGVYKMRLEGGLLNNGQGMTILKGSDPANNRRLKVEDDFFREQLKRFQPLIDQYANLPK